MSFYAFLGCDGSGKSAVIERLTSRMRDGGVEVTCGHWRPQAFRRHDSDELKKTAEDPHGQIPRGTLSSILKLAWLGLNWWCGWWRGLARASRHGVVLFDRYHGDLVVDPRRYRYGGPMSLAKFASHVMPQPDIVFFLDAEPEVLLGRKQEVSPEALAVSRSAYLKMAEENPRVQVVDAGRELDEVVDHVYKLMNQEREGGGSNEALDD